MVGRGLARRGKQTSGQRVEANKKSGQRVEANKNQVGASRQQKSGRRVDATTKRDDLCRPDLDLELDSNTGFE